MKHLLLLVLVILAACGSGETVDTPADGNGNVDAPSNLPACTGAAYDPCTDNSQCTSNNCHLYMQSQFQVCVQACTPGDNTTCPVDKSGANGVCNNMGICKPAAPNACMR